jgi:hypothetical protein
MASAICSRGGNHQQTNYRSEDERANQIPPKPKRLMPAEQGDQKTKEYIYDKYYHKAHGHPAAQPRSSNQVASISHTMDLLLALPV